MENTPSPNRSAPEALRPAGSCGRSSGVVVAAPTTAFLDEDEARWIVFTNLRSFWDRDDQQDFAQATDHILQLLHRFLDAASEEHDEEIANEINEAMTGLNQVIVPNTMYRPGADWNDISDRISTKPFLLGNLEGVAGAYTSLGRFLTCRYVARLKRCQGCGGIFIAPTDDPCTCCPDGR